MRMFGADRVFHSALAHVAEEYSAPEMAPLLNVVRSALQEDSDCVPAVREAQVA